MIRKYFLFYSLLLLIFERQFRLKRLTLKANDSFTELIDSLEQIRARGSFKLIKPF